MYQPGTGGEWLCAGQQSNEVTMRILPAASLVHFAGVVCLTALAATSVVGACEAPDYRIGTVLEDTPSAMVMTISISLRDFAPPRLACLGNKLYDEYRDRHTVSISIVSNADAARNYVPPFFDMPPKMCAREAKLHGVFLLQSTERAPFIELIPDALTMQELVPRIVEKHDPAHYATIL